VGFAAHLAKSWMTKSGLAEADNLNGLENQALSNQYMTEVAVQEKK
jgi:hypothetical protein